MTDSLLLNGGKKATACVRFDQTAFLLLKGEKIEFPNVKKMRSYIQEKKLEVAIEHIFPGGIRK